MSSAQGRASGATEEIRIIPPRHIGRKILAVVALAAAAGIGYLLISNPNLNWAVVGYYFTESSILTGVLMTLQLTVISMVIGIALGVLLAIMQLSDNRVFRALSGVYIWFFRGTPQLIQLIFWFNLAFLFPRIGFGEFSLDTNAVITPFLAAIIGLSLNEGAYMAEIVRAGIQGVDKGQREAGVALSLTPAKIMFLVTLPQAMRLIIPPTGNQAIAMLKVTSLVSVISARELLTSAQIIYAKNFLVMELLIVASIWYLVMTTIATIGQHWIEKKYSKGVAQQRIAARGGISARRKAGTTTTAIQVLAGVKGGGK